MDLCDVVPMDGGQTERICIPEDSLGEQIIGNFVGMAWKDIPVEATLETVANLSLFQPQSTLF